MHIADKILLPIPNVFFLTKRHFGVCYSLIQWGLAGADNGFKDAGKDHEP